MKVILFTSPNTVTMEGTDGVQVKGVSTRELAKFEQVLGDDAETAVKRGELSQSTLAKAKTGEGLEFGLQKIRERWLLK